MPPKAFDVSWLFPDFSQLWNYTNLASWLSSFFCGLIFVVAIVFSGYFWWRRHQALKNIKWLSELLASVTKDNAVEKRNSLIEEAKKGEKIKSNVTGHLWLQFNETLVRQDSPTLKLKSTLDPRHFFNARTLATGALESRLIAAVPGFLTAFGLLGTFVGLLVGLSGLDLSGHIEQMRHGITSVVDGAKTAFITSVWGVITSVLFNFLEKAMEQTLRSKLYDLQAEIEKRFPRLRAEEQLRELIHYDKESSITLQTLAEQIGTKMQESVFQVSENMQSTLEKCLEELLLPTLEHLKNEATSGSQKALENLVAKFSDGIQSQGSDQRDLMTKSAEEFQTASASMSQTINTLTEQLERSHIQSQENEEKLSTCLATQLNDFLENNQKQINLIGETLHENINDITGKIYKDSQNQNADFLEQLKTQLSSVLANIEDNARTSYDNNIELNQGLQVNFSELLGSLKSQSASIKQVTNEGVSSFADLLNERDLNLENKINQLTDSLATTGKNLHEQTRESVDATLNASKSILEQGKALQIQIESWSSSNQTFSKELSSASSELNKASSNATELSKNLDKSTRLFQEAASTLSNKTIKLEELLARTANDLKQYQNKYSNVVTQLDHVVPKIERLFENSNDCFDRLSKTQNDFLLRQKQHVDELNTRVTQMLENYAAKANTQTADHLKIWSESTTDYATKMNDSMNALSAIVEEIEDKITR